MRVDTLGLIRGLAVLPASVQDGTGAGEVVRRAGRSPRSAKVRADAGHKAFREWVSKHCRWALGIVTRQPGRTTVVVRPNRRIAERALGWLGRYRRVPKGYEHDTRSREAWICGAMIHRMSRFTLPQGSRDDDRLRRPTRCPKP